MIYRAGSLPESSRTRPTAPGRQRESEAGPGRKADYRCAGPADQSQLSAIRGQTASTQNVNGYPLAYSVRSKGPSVVFVGGVLTDYRIWSRGQALRESEFRTVAVSPRHFYPEPWRGTGSDFTVAQHAKDLAEFIQDQDGPVFLVGWSYGAQIAFETARARPDLVKKLVLAEAPLYTRLPPEDDGAKIISDRSRATAKYFERGDIEGGLNFAIDEINGPGVWSSMEEGRRQGVRDNAWTVVGIGRDDSAPESCTDFGALKMPVLLVQGETTTARFHKLVAREASCLPTAKVVTSIAPPLSGWLQTPSTGAADASDGSDPRLPFARLGSRHPRTYLGKGRFPRERPIPKEAMRPSPGCMTRSTPET